MCKYMKLQILFDIFLNALLDVNLHILSHSQNQIFIKLIKMFEVKSFQYLIDHTKLQGTPFVNVIFNYKKVISMNIHIYFFNLHSENRYIVSFIIWEIRKWSFKIWLLSYGTPYAKRNWGHSMIIHRKTIKLLFRNHFNFKLVFYAYKYGKFRFNHMVYNQYLNKVRFLLK